MDRIEARRRLVLKKQQGMEADKARAQVAREMGCDPTDLMGIAYALLVPQGTEHETSSGTRGFTLPEQQAWTASADTPSPDSSSSPSE